MPEKYSRTYYEILYNGDDINNLKIDGDTVNPSMNGVVLPPNDNDYGYWLYCSYKFDETGYARFGRCSQRPSNIFSLGYGGRNYNLSGDYEYWHWDFTNMDWVYMGSGINTSYMLATSRASNAGFLYKANIIWVNVPFGTSYEGYFPFTEDLIITNNWRRLSRLI